MGGRGKRPRVPTEPVAENKTIVAAFARQQRGRECPVCHESIARSCYRSHLDACRMDTDDSDVEVICAMTGPMSRKIKAGSPIHIDGDENIEADENNPSSAEDVPSTEGSSTSESQRNDPDYTQHLPAAATPEPSQRRRSARIMSVVNAAQTSTTTAVDVPNVKPEKVTPKAPVASKRRRPVTPVIMEAVVQEVTLAEAVIAASEDTSASMTVVTKKRSVITRSRAAVVDVVRSPSIAPPTPKEPAAKKTTVKTEVIKASELIAQIDELLAVQPLAADVPNVTSIPPADDEALVVRGTPYFVTFVIKMMRKILSTVTATGRHYDETFWGDDMMLMKKFLDVSHNARQLFMRMFLRKRSWLTSAGLRQRYAELADSLDESLTQLEKDGFVDSGKTHLLILEEALSLLPLPGLRIIAKQFQQDITKGKHELAVSLLSFANSQKSLFGSSVSVEKKMLILIKKELGDCHRVNEAASRLFKAIFTLYSPTETNSAAIIDKPNGNIEQDMLFLMLQQCNGSVRFPSPDPCPHIIDIFPSKAELMQYVSAKEVEVEMVRAASYNKLDRAVEIGNAAKLELIQGECSRLLAPMSLVPAGLRRFSAPWVLMRCVGLLSSYLEKQKKFALAILLQRMLLTTQALLPFCMDSRGSWWDRLALNLDHHMKEKEDALDELKRGMADTNVAEKDRLLLQDRALRINRELEQIIVIGEPDKRVIRAAIMSKELGDSRINRFVIKEANGDICECSVEEVVRRHYLKQEGFNKAVHAEGSIWHTVLGLLFDDIIFDHSVPQVWLSEIQMCPIDLNYSMFSTRKEKMDERLSWLEGADDDDVRERVGGAWTRRHGETNTEIDWKLFDHVDECCSFIESCPRAVLVMVLRRVLSDYRNTRSGFPDLTVWNTDLKTVAVVEVKGPGDRLSTKQRLWLHYFKSVGARAEVCHVEASNDKRLS